MAYTPNTPLHILQTITLKHKACSTHLLLSLLNVALNYTNYIISVSKHHNKNPSVHISSHCVTVTNQVA